MAATITALARFAVTNPNMGHAYPLLSAALLPAPLVVALVAQNRFRQRPALRVVTAFLAGSAAAVATAIAVFPGALVAFGVAGFAGLVLTGGSAPLILVGGDAESTPWVPAAALFAFVLVAVARVPAGPETGLTPGAQSTLTVAGLAACLAAALLWAWRIVRADRRGRMDAPRAPAIPFTRRAGLTLLFWLPVIALRIASGFVPGATVLRSLESSTYPALLLVVPSWAYAELISHPRLVRAWRTGRSAPVRAEELRRMLLLQLLVGLVSLLFAPGIDSVFDGTNTSSWIVAVTVICITTTAAQFVIDRGAQRP